MVDTRSGPSAAPQLKAGDPETLEFTLAEVEAEIGCRRVADLEEMVAQCDVVTINAPLHPETEHMFNDKLLGKMKRGAYLVNQNNPQRPNFNDLRIGVWYAFSR